MREDTGTLWATIEVYFDVMNRPLALGLVAPHDNAALCLVPPRLWQILEAVICESQQALIR